MIALIWIWDYFALILEFSMILVILTMHTIYGEKCQAVTPNICHVTCPDILAFLEDNYYYSHFLYEGVGTQSN